MNNVFVIKCGGNFAMEKKWTTPLFLSIKELIEKGFLVVIVHGGGPQVDDLAHKLHIPIKKINGKRITDYPTLQIAKMIYVGLINTNLVSLSIAHGVLAVGISGVSSKLAEVVKRPIVQIRDITSGTLQSVDFGYVGDIKKINKKLLKLLLQNGYLPIVSCLGVDDSGQAYNINADRLAAHIAIKLKAKKLIFISDVQGISSDKKKEKILANLQLNEANELISKGIITDGMIPKIENSLLALEKNVKNVQILGPLNTKKEWEDAFLNEKFGTVITQGGI